MNGVRWCLVENDKQRKKKTSKRRRERQKLSIKGGRIAATHALANPSPSLNCLYFSLGTRLEATTFQWLSTKSFRAVCVWPLWFWSWVVIFIAFSLPLHSYSLSPSIVLQRRSMWGTREFEKCLIHQARPNRADETNILFAKFDRIESNCWSSGWNCVRLARRAGRCNKRPRNYAATHNGWFNRGRIIRPS